MPSPKPADAEGNAADMGDDILLGRVDLKPRLDANNVSWLQNSTIDSHSIAI